MTDRELMQQGYEVPLVEQLDAVPRDARLWIKNSDGMGSRHFPIGLMCHKAAEALRAQLAQPERQWQGLTEQEHANIAVDVGCASADWVFYGAAVERALKEKNK